MTAVKVDMLDKSSAETLPDGFDFIASNPPYIRDKRAAAFAARSAERAENGAGRRRGRPHLLPRNLRYLGEKLHRTACLP